MIITDIIANKRDKKTLSEAEIAFFVQGATDGSIPDYQLSALLMAIYLNGMNGAETALLTKAMAESGTMLDLGEIEKRKPILDKHSTGGVGDKVSLIVIPLLAACGIAICKMSGRGLGHTGGTLDKLEAIDGFRIALSESEMLAQVRDIGVCLVGQTADLAPADKKLYALRDVTATVGSLPLIVASILSKKLAGGASSFLFDVKVGDGALMKTEHEARELAQALVDGAKANRRRAVAILSDMSQPLGRAIGNALEVQEALDVLTPEKVVSCDSRLVTLCELLATEGVMLALGLSPDEASKRVRNVWHSGQALAKMHEMITAQGGNLSQGFPRASVEVPVFAESSGYIQHIAAQKMGEFVVSLGGGRRQKEDRIDPRVGIILHASVGMFINKDDLLATIYLSSENMSVSEMSELQVNIQQLYNLTPSFVEEPLLVLERLG
jgi:pyrimidine-nucleoside phosphorylase